MLRTDCLSLRRRYDALCRLCRRLLRLCLSSLSLRGVHILNPGNLRSSSFPPSSRSLSRSSRSLSRSLSASLPLCLSRCSFLPLSHPHLSPLPPLSPPLPCAPPLSPALLPTHPLVRPLARPSPIGRYKNRGFNDTFKIFPNGLYRQFIHIPNDIHSPSHPIAPSTHSTHTATSHPPNDGTAGRHPPSPKCTAGSSRRVR